MRGVKHAEGAMWSPYLWAGGEEYPLDEIRRPIVTETEAADAGDFPKNITEHFWIRPGQNDGDSWMACGALDNGAFFFFTGGCDFTGFGCQGGMSLWVSRSWANILEHAMTEEERELFEAQTEVPPAEGEEPWPEMTEEEFWAARRAEWVCYECGEKGAEHEHPEDASVALCEACYQSSYGPRGSGPCLVCKAEGAAHEHPLSSTELPLFLCDVCDAELKSGPDPRAWVGRALAHRPLIAGLGSA
jgi:hypothetical protein